MVPVSTTSAYRHYRVHLSRLFSGVWVASVVAPGGVVDHVRGEFSTQEDALKSAEQLIDCKADTSPHSAPDHPR